MKVNIIDGEELKAKVKNRPVNFFVPIKRVMPDEIVAEYAPKVYRCGRRQALMDVMDYVDATGEDIEQVVLKMLANEQSYESSFGDK